MLESIIANLFEFIFSIFPVLFVVFLIVFSVKKSLPKRENSQRSGRVKPRPVKPSKTVSSDGHVIDPENDPTCAKYGHVHEEVKHRYIVHDEPVEGYVNLNGKLISLKEAAKY